MKTAIFTSVLCLFSGLVSSVAIPSAEPAAIEARSIATISPSLSVPIYQDDPDYAGGAQSYAQVSRVSWTCFDPYPESFNCIKFDWIATDF